jgi:MYXO-CTERM domain-containing protein
MKKHIATGLLALGLCALPLAGVASAQQTGGSYSQQAQQTARDAQNQAEQAAHDAANKGRGMDWGWLGLFGLAGLAGLRRKHDDTATTRDTFRTREPLASR